MLFFYLTINYVVGDYTMNSDEKKVTEVHQVQYVDGAFTEDNVNILVYDMVRLRPNQAVILCEDIETCVISEDLKHLLLYENHVKVVEYLEHECELLFVGDSRYHPYAIRGNNPHIKKILIQYGVRPDENVILFGEDRDRIHYLQNKLLQATILMYSTQKE